MKVATVIFESPRWYGTSPCDPVLHEATASGQPASMRLVSGTPFQMACRGELMLPDEKHLHRFALTLLKSFEFPGKHVVDKSNDTPGYGYSGDNVHRIMDPLSNQHESHGDQTEDHDDPDPLVLAEHDQDRQGRRVAREKEVFGEGVTAISESVDYGVTQQDHSWRWL